ncbi:MAG TPA: toxin-antitoxin system HicB family antitoxin [Labilithrix sp.]|nr:toxin-antitoxin system HicB family antitoxin [Labilithrix sp.]
MPAFIAINACMGTKAHQYTIRNVSPRVHRALRAKAVARGISLNTLVLQALEAEAGLGTKPRVYDDLDDLFGTWVQDDAVNQALTEQRRVDPKDWE